MSDKIVKADSDEVEPETVTVDDSTNEQKDTLGDLLSNSPTFQKLIQKRATVYNAVPGIVVTRQVKTRIWDIPLGPEIGKAGQQIIISMQPRCIFRGERLIANDTAKIPGTGTRIKQVLVGRRLQADFRERPTYDFMNGADITMDTCQPAFSIVFYIDFLEDCTWWGSLVGMAAF